MRGPPEMPSEFAGREEERWWTEAAGLPQAARQPILLAAYARAAADEQRARAEMESAMAGGDAHGARSYGGLVKDMRAQVVKFYGELC